MSDAAQQHVASALRADNPSQLSTPSSSLDDIRATIAHWKRRGLTAREAWQAITGRKRADCGWRIVEAAMIRSALGRPITVVRRKPKPLGVDSFRFLDDPRAARDHGSPGRVSRPPTFVASQASL